MKASISLFAFLLLLAASCTKDSTLKPPVTPPVDDTTPVQPYVPTWPMIKTISYSYNGQTTTEQYYYDSLWRLTRLEYTGGRSNTYTYSYDSLGVYLNGSMLMSFDSRGLALYEYPMYNSYTFNSDSNMTGHSGDNFGHTYSYSNGNMISAHSWVENGGLGVGFTDVTYTYNTRLNTTGNYNRGTYYRGHSSVNLVERNDWNNSLGGGGGGNRGFILYSYVYNNSGWVSQMEEQEARISTIYIDSVTTIYDTTIHTTIYDYTYY